MKKNAQGMPLNVIIIALIVITTAVIVIAVFTGMFRKEGSELDKRISGLGDCDDDDVANMFDECPCDPDEEPDEEGKCPKGEKLKPKSCDCEHKDDE